MEDTIIAVGEHVGGTDLIVRQGLERLVSTCEDMSQLTSGPLIRFFLLTDHHHVRDKSANK